MNFAITSFGKNIGDVRTSVLDESTFQEQNGVGWVLADGRSVIDSAYATITGSTTVPDMRATVPRMKDNGAGLNPDGELALGTYQADAIAQHGHSTVGNPSSLSGGPDVVYNTFNNSAGRNTGNVVGATAAAETRGKNTTVNFFIKIN